MDIGTLALLALFGVVGAVFQLWLEYRTGREPSTQKIVTGLIGGAFGGLLLWLFPEQVTEIVGIEPGPGSAFLAGFMIDAIAARFEERKENVG